MTFDCIIMNPPYDGSLHLKIVEKAIEFLKDDNSICVNLSPVRWLQDPLAKYKKGSDYNKFEESIVNHINTLDIVDKFDAAKQFGMLCDSDLGVYLITKRRTGFEVSSNKILDKIIFTNKKVLSDVIDKDTNDGWRVRINEQKPEDKNNKDNPKNERAKFYLTHKELSYVFYNGKKEDGTRWQDYKLAQVGSTSNRETMAFSIHFDKKSNAVSFEESTKTTFYKYLHSETKVDQHTPLGFLPWLGDVENPRTHKMGYESDWTNEDLCKVFNITGFISDTEAEPGSEWETILETMKPYL